MNYRPAEQKLITKLFESFREHNVTFVVPRGHSELPESTFGGDIDIYIQENDFKKAIKITQNVGFKPKLSEAGGIVHLAVNAGREPIRAVDMFFNQIDEVLDLLIDAAHGDYNSAGSSYEEWKGYDSNIMIHLMNHLAYESPMNGQMIRVDPAVEDSFFKNSTTIDGIPVPDQSDELLHLLCRGIYSKEGVFPEHYVDRCNELTKIVFDSPDSRSKFEQLLSDVFFDADELILKLVVASEYNCMREQLKCYSNY